MRNDGKSMLDARDLYLDLMKRVLTNSIYEDPNVGPWQPPRYSRELRLEGRDWPRDAHTMIGTKRLDNLQRCVEDVLLRNVPGDLLEAGVWRGGAAIFMRAVLKAHEVTDRTVWVADSFRGLPVPDPERWPADAGDRHHEEPYLSVSSEVVRSNFERYGLLDGQVNFLEGWFRDTLPTAPVERLSVLRLDGDMYESTIDALSSLYPKVSIAGYIIIDDYKVVPGCRQAVEDYRKSNGITEPIREIDWAGVYWQRLQ
jgi:Macrocin-O-methyltransferase (TylF)